MFPTLRSNGRIPPNIVQMSVEPLWQYNTYPCLRPPGQQPPSMLPATLPYIAPPRPSASTCVGQSRQRAWSCGGWRPLDLAPARQTGQRPPTSPWSSPSGGYSLLYGRRRWQREAIAAASRQHYEGDDASEWQAANGARRRRCCHCHCHCHQHYDHHHRQHDTPPPILALLLQEYPIAGMRPYSSSYTAAARRAPT
jgi:hypothetical protein